MKDDASKNHQQEQEEPSVTVSKPENDGIEEKPTPGATEGIPEERQPIGEIKEDIDQTEEKANKQVQVGMPI